MRASPRRGGANLASSAPTSTRPSHPSTPYDGANTPPVTVNKPPNGPARSDGAEVHWARQHLCISLRPTSPRVVPESTVAVAKPTATSHRNEAVFRCKISQITANLRQLPPTKAGMSSWAKRVTELLSHSDLAPDIAQNSDSARAQGLWSTRPKDGEAPGLGNRSISRIQSPIRDGATRMLNQT